MSSTFKTWLVLLLALILPLEGVAVAAGVACHAASMPVVAQAAHAFAPRGSHHDERAPVADIARDAPRHASHHVDRNVDPRTRHPAAPHDAVGTVTIAAVTIDASAVADIACLACAGICSASPLPVSHLLTLPTDAVVRAEPTAACIAPPSHVAAGLERPPRPA